MHTIIHNASVGNLLSDHARHRWKTIGCSDNYETPKTSTIQTTTHTNRIAHDTEVVDPDGHGLVLQLMPVRPHRG